MKELPKAFSQNTIFKNLKIFRANPVKYMEDSFRQCGSPVNLNLPMGDFVLVADPEQAFEVLVNNHLKYKKSRGYREIARVLGNGILTNEGEAWKKQRKALQPAFHKNEIREFAPAIWKTGVDFIESWEDRFVLPADKQMGRLTLTVLLNTLIQQHSEEIKDSMAANVVFGQRFATDRIRSPIKLPTWLPIPKNIKYHRLKKEMDRHIHSFIEERKKVDFMNIKDLLSLLMIENGVDAFSTIRDELITFLVAGHETSSLGLSWTLYLLAGHPDIQEKARMEVDKINALEDIDLHDFSNLTYLQKVIKESLRIYPPVWNIVREAQEPDEVGGYLIPKGKQVMMNIFLIHRNEKYWENPLVFDPDRFEARHEENWHKYQYMPFGGGPRFCIGNNFAMHEMLLLMTLFLKHFRFKRKDNDPIGYDPLLTLRPGREIELVVERVGAER